MTAATIAVPTSVGIHARFREALVRVTDGRTGKRLARQAGYSPAAVRSWRQGRRTPIDKRVIDLLAASEVLEREFFEMVAERKRVFGK